MPPVPEARWSADNLVGLLSLARPAERTVQTLSHHPGRNNGERALPPRARGAVGTATLNKDAGVERKAPGGALGVGGIVRHQHECGLFLSTDVQQ